MVVLNTEVARQPARRIMTPLPVGLQVESHVSAKRIASEEFTFVLEAKEVSLEEVSKKFGAIGLQEGEPRTPTPAPRPLGRHRRQRQSPDTRRCLCMDTGSARGARLSIIGVS